MKGLIINIFVLFQLTLLPLPLFGQGKNVSTLVEKVLEAAGGRSQWETIKTRIDFCESTHVNDMLNAHNMISYMEHSTSIIWYKKVGTELPLQKIVIVDKLNDEDTFSTCYNGNAYWTHKTNSEPINMDFFAESYGKFVNCGYPDQLLRADSIVYSDSISALEESYEVIKVYTYGTLSVLYINKNDYLIEKIIFSPTSILNPPSNTISFLSEYSLIQGRVIPLLIETYQHDKLIYRAKYTKVIFDRELESSFFAFPESPPYPILEKQYKEY